MRIRWTAAPPPPPASTIRCWIHTILECERFDTIHTEHNIHWSACYSHCVLLICTLKHQQLYWPIQRYKVSSCCSVSRPVKHYLPYHVGGHEASQHARPWTYTSKHTHKHIHTQGTRACARSKRAPGHAHTLITLPPSHTHERARTQFARLAVLGPH